MFKPTDLFDLQQTEHADLFAGVAAAWQALPALRAYVERKLLPRLLNRCVGVAWIDENVSIGEGTVVEDGAMIKGPAIIGRNCEIRHNAYIRGPVLIGDDCVVGNTSEVKNSVLFNGVAAAHFNYVGDSILGHAAHLGAGVKICNVKLKAGNVRVSEYNTMIDSGLAKFGALVGDHAEIGCNVVLNPGSVLGRNTVIYPGVFWRGTLAIDCIVKNRSAVEIVSAK